MILVTLNDLRSWTSLIIVDDPVPNGGQAPRIWSSSVSKSIPVLGYPGCPLLYVVLALKVMACPNTDTELKQNMFKHSSKVPISPPRG